jgi:hypothetical protein
MTVRSNFKHNFREARPLRGFKKFFSKARFRSGSKKNLEDTIEYLAQQGIIAKAGLHAIRAQHKMGLAVTIKIGGSIYSLYPNGRKVEISRISNKPTHIEQDTLQIPD